MPRTPVPDYDRPRPPSAFALDADRAARVFQRPAMTVTRPDDLFATAVGVPGGPHIVVPTHYDPAAGSPRLVAYDDALEWRQSDIARFFAPGEVFICVKHHKPAHPDLTSAGKEAIKFDATHIQIGVGVEGPDETGGRASGAITINNPQDYKDGLFGSDAYPMIFLKLVFPASIDARTRRQYVDNIRTWLLIANTYTEFPDDYNGGDPLGTRSVSQIEEFGDTLLQALVGTPAERERAIAWLQDPAHLVYCAELAHVAVNLGVHVPLNQARLGGRFRAVKAALKSKAFLERNRNPHASRVDLGTAAESLKPITDLLGVAPTEAGPDAPFGSGLALVPFTVADMVEHFVRDHIPRRELGEQSAPAQAQLLEMVRPGLMEAMGLDRLPPTDPSRVAVESLFDAITAYVGTPAEDYAAFRRGLEPLLQRARQLTGPRPDGSGAFMPPHAWLLHALGRADNTGGVLGVEIVGHGLHASLLRPV